MINRIYIYIYIPRIENTSESDPRSYEAIQLKQLERKPRKNSEASTVRCSRSRAKTIIIITSAIQLGILIFDIFISCFYEIDSLLTHTRSGLSAINY